ncbi:MAG: GH25 family lysozyme [Eubacteriales bacterium]|nr:GH25 family lysozyme [Eubacteriales bacterium]
MKKRMLALLLALCCTGGSMTAALAVDATEEVSDPNKVVAFSEADDPLAHCNRGEDLQETVFDGTMAAEYAASTYSYVSPFNGKSYQVPDGYNVYNGIDVAKYQGDINWTKVKNAGVDFAFIRVGYRGYGSGGSLAQDPYYTSNMKKANAAGVPVGIYIFSQALNVEEAIAEANFAIKRASDYSIALPIVMDYEFAGGTSGRLTKAVNSGELTRSQMTANVLAFFKTVKDAGYTPMVYADYSFSTNCLDVDTICAEGEYWIARYNYSVSTSSKPYNHSYDCWQYSDGLAAIDGVDTKIDGINANGIDLDFYFKTGSLTDHNNNTNNPPAPQPTPDPEPTPTPTPAPSGNFSDVASTAWYADAIRFVAQNRVMIGTSDTTFTPNLPLKRGETAQLLYNMSGKPAVSGVNNFNDVYKGDWYDTAITWVSKAGIMSGSNKNFRPTIYITREDFATALYNYSRYYQINTNNITSLNGYRDAWNISDYAKTPMQWAVANGIMQGYNGALSPKGTATRAECATMLKNYLTGIGSSLLK